jgi:DNA polymerase-3 subunit gamma/tau
MSYIVFALKWRPQNFDEIVGQGHIVTTLKSALQKNRLSHAYLFAGPRGVGKTSTARILAKALNCKGGPTVSPCGKCPSCVDITGGRSLDVIEIDGASNRGIDEIRVLRENIKFAPTSGKFKIYIIDEVHMLTHEAFNALLKTLEEPPEFVKFFFATTQPNKVIPTILSRCQRFDFRRIPVMEIIAQLEKITASEQISVDKDVLCAIAKSSDGALRDAESILDQLVSFSKGKISLKDAISVLGLIEQDILFQITDTIIRKDAKAALGMFNDVIDEGKDVGVFLSNLIEHFRNLMVAKITQADPKLIDLPEDVCKKLWDQAQRLSLEEIFNAFNTLINTQEIARRLESARIPLEISLVKLAHDKRATGTVAQPAAAPRKEIAPAKMDPAPARDPIPAPREKAEEAVPEPESQEPQAQGDCSSLDAVKDTWKAIIENVGRIKMSVATYLNEGTPAKLEKGVFVVSFPKDYSLHKESLERKENKEIIEAAISQVCNVRVRVQFILSQEAVRKETSDNPIVKSALDMFDGRVIREE